jgi:prefoldin subunit 5
MGDVRNDIAEVDAAIAAVEEDLDEEVEELQAELDAVHEELEEAEQFRERLSDVFGAN